MDSEGPLLTEGLSTHITRIRFLPCVSSLMYDEFGLFTEGLPTLCTFEGLHFQL